jgi:uncharacterized protein YjiS (DUF1127 family)
MWAYTKDEADFLAGPRDPSLTAGVRVSVRSDDNEHVLGPLVLGLIGWWRRWTERQRVEAELCRMADRDLADIGLTRGDIPAILDGTLRCER